MSTGSELVDVLDEQGRVVGVATRAEVRAGNLWHRTVFVAVVTPEDEVAVHQRADWKDVWPSRWDLCFGGVVAAGEAWSDAAARELAEEAGVVVGVEALALLGDRVFDGPEVRERCRIFRVGSSGPFSPNDGEVVAIELVPRAGLEDWCAGHDLVPDSVEVVLPLLLADQG
jgi:8-oxo-dGTP pyrophosphatase MutT (NUDIX family)